MAKIRRIEIEPAENGGHTVTHHFQPASGKGFMTGSHKEPQAHVFGANEGHAMLVHVANTLDIPEDEPSRKLTPDAAEAIRAKANA